MKLNNICFNFLCETSEDDALRGLLRHTKRIEMDGFCLEESNNGVCARHFVTSFSKETFGEEFEPEPLILKLVEKLTPYLKEVK